MKKNSAQPLDESNERILYSPENPYQMIDWMGYEINEDNPLISSNNKEVVDTAALTEYSCKALSLMKTQDEELYDNWLAAFAIIDRRVIDPTPDEFVWDLMTELHFQTDILMKQATEKSPKR